MSKNKKQPKVRNYVVKQMIERNQKAGKHADKKKEEEKYKCRQKVQPDEE